MSKFTDEQIEAALDAYAGNEHIDMLRSERMREALTAAAEAAPAPDHVADAGKMVEPKWREVLQQAEAAFEFIRLNLIHNLEEPERQSFWKAIALRDVIRAALASAPPPESASGLSQAVRDVLAERQRQIAKGYDATHDDEHKRGQIIWADWGAMYRLAQYVAPSTRMLLVEAAAQVIAEIERLDRLPASPASGQEG